MSDDAAETPRIQVDTDWKTEARQEKERLAAEAAKQAKRGPLPNPTFAEIVNMIVMQAAIGLGGFATSAGQQIPPDLDVAKHHIDMLEVLEKKTGGNLTPEEKQLLDGALYELRMRYVDAVSRPGQRPPAAPPR